MSQPATDALFTPHKPEQYRPDIDGLRALAVVPVVLFHAGLKSLAGGYVGVDVFFVISGYLITANIFREARQDRFSILTFYERRFRRIFPALAAVLLTSLVVGWFILLPYDYQELGQSTASVGLFASNVLFFFKTGYFDTASELKPLLHTWSLGVEEQFYIAWPFVILLFVRLPTKWAGGLIWALFLASLLLSQYLVQENRSAAFYLIFPRAFELIVGAVIALGIVPDIRNRTWLQIIGLSGLVMIAVAMATFSHEVPFPGLAALLPSVGAGLVIYAGKDSAAWSRRLLSMKPFIWIGLISYSLYLWHWPVMVAFRYIYMEDLTLARSLLAIVISIVLAALTYRFIETPFRQKTFMVRKTVLLSGAAFIAATLFIGAGLHITKGLPTRLPADVVRLASGSADTNPRRKACDHPSAERIRNNDICRIGTPNVAPSYAIVGDSFADALSPGLDTAGQTTGRAGVVLTYGGCPFLPNVRQPQSDCEGNAKLFLDYLKTHSELSTIYVVNRWTAVATASRYGVFKTDKYWMQDQYSRETSAEENRHVVVRSLEALIDALPGRQIVFVSGIPEQEVDAPRFLAEARLMKRDETPPFDARVRQNRYDAVKSVFDRLATPTRLFKVVDLSKDLCMPGSCPLTRDGRMIFADDNHLTTTETHYLSSRFAPYLLSSKDMSSRAQDRP